MRKTVMVLAAVLALMFGGASIAMGADHNRPEGNDNSPCAEDHPGAASERNPHCTGDGPPGHQDDDPETDTVEADLDAPEEDGGDEAAEEDGDNGTVEEVDGDEAVDEDGDDDAVEEVNGDEIAEEDGDENPETDTVEAEQDAGDTEGDAGAETDGDAGAETDGDAGAETDGDADEVEGDAGAEESDAAADADDGDDVADADDALEDRGVVTGFLLTMDDFFGDLFVSTDEADEVEVG